MSLLHGLCSCRGHNTAYSGQWWWTGRFVDAPVCAACNGSPQFRDLKRARVYLKSRQTTKKNTKGESESCHETRAKTNL